MLHLNFRKRKKGNVFIEMLISIFVLLFIVLLLTTEIQPLVIYFDLRQTARTALLQMETTGGITQEIRDEITNSINFNDYDSSYLTITPEENITPSTSIPYGQKTSIDLDYAYYHKVFSLDGFSIVTKTEIQNIGVHFETTSKKAQ